jgi:hypothetical protein
MRNWMLLVLAGVVLVAVGCTSDVHNAVRDGHNGGPTTDTGVLPQGTSTTGGDAAGSLNLEKGKGEKHESSGEAGH